MRGTLAAAVAAVVFATGAGCTLILGGNKDYHEIDGGGAAGGSGGGVGVASGGASASSSGSGGGPAGSGGSGGAQQCKPADPASCPGSERCMVVDTKTGATQCGLPPSMPVAVYDYCVSDQQCPKGAWCDHDFSGVCRPFCETAASCGGAPCIDANTSQGPIPGIKVCMADCDPISSAPCGAHAVCEWNGFQDVFDCMVSQGKDVGAACDYAGDCKQGLVCVGNMCAAWCASDVDCNFPSQCLAFTNIAPKHDNKTYGFCGN